MVDVAKMPVMRKLSSDDFQTPPEALLPLFPRLNKKWVIWECAEGEGNLTTALKKNGFKVIGTDILTGKDFLTWRPKKFDCIITNPPYSLKQQFLERAYQLGKPFAFLLPLTTLETRKRQGLFNDHGVEMIIFDRRIHFETPQKKDSKSWFQVAWFTNGLNIGKQLNFVKFNEGDIMSIKELVKKINWMIAGVKTYTSKLITGPGHIISWSNAEKKWDYIGYLAKTKKYPVGPDYILISKDWATKDEMIKVVKYLDPLPLAKKSFEVAPVSKRPGYRIGKVISLPKMGKFIHEYHDTSKNWDTIRSIKTNGHVVRIGYSDYHSKAKLHKKYGLVSILHPYKEKGILTKGPCDFVKTLKKKGYLEKLAEGRGKWFELDGIKELEEAEVRPAIEKHKKRLESVSEESEFGGLDDQLKLLLETGEEVNDEIKNNPAPSIELWAGIVVSSPDFRDAFPPTSAITMKDSVLLSKLIIKRIIETGAWWQYDLSKEQIKQVAKYIIETYGEPKAQDVGRDINELRVVKILDKEFYVDERLLQIREVNNPGNFKDFESLLDMTEYIEKNPPIEGIFRETTEIKLLDLLAMVKSKSELKRFSENWPVSTLQSKFPDAYTAYKIMSTKFGVDRSVDMSVSFETYDEKMNKLEACIKSAINSWKYVMKEIGLPTDDMHWKSAEVARSKALKVLETFSWDEVEAFKGDYLPVQLIISKPVKKWTLKEVKWIQEQFLAEQIQILTDSEVGYLETLYPDLEPAKSLMDFTPATIDVGDDLDEKIAKVKENIGAKKKLVEILTKQLPGADAATKKIINDTIEVQKKELSGLQKFMGQLKAQMERQKIIGTKLKADLIKVMDKHKDLISGFYKSLEIYLIYPMKPENIRLIAVKTGTHIGVVLEGTFIDKKKRKIGFPSGAVAAGYMAGLHNLMHPETPIEVLPNLWWSNPKVMDKWLGKYFPDWKLFEVVSTRAKIKEALEKYPIPATPIVSPVLRPYQKEAKA